VTNIVRKEDSVDAHTPVLVELTEAEIDKIEKDRERDARYVYEIKYAFEKPAHNSEFCITILLITTQTETTPDPWKTRRNSS